MPEIERYIQNSDIRKMTGCCPATASKIIKNLKKMYGIKNEELPKANTIPLSVYNYHFRQRTNNDWSKRLKENSEKPKENEA